jgi:hypothetical protein
VGFNVTGTQARVLLVLADGARRPVDVGAELWVVKPDRQARHYARPAAVVLRRLLERGLVGLELGKYALNASGRARLSALKHKVEKP